MGVDHDFLVRPAQVEVALQMILPSSGNNSLMQLNMGAGKTSVVAPMVVNSLADRKRMVRLIVLEQLFAQICHLMTG